MEGDRPTRGERLALASVILTASLLTFSVVAEVQNERRHRQILRRLGA